MVVAGDPDGDGTGGCAAAYATGAGRGQVVNVAGDDKQHGSVCLFERLLDAGGVEQPEGDIKGFAEASVAVVMDVPAVHDGADPEPAVAITWIREAGVVAREHPAEGREARLSSSAWSEGSGSPQRDRQAAHRRRELP